MSFCSKVKTSVESHHRENRDRDRDRGVCPIETYIASVKPKAENLIKHTFQQRVAALNKLLSSPDFNIEDKKSLRQILNIRNRVPNRINSEGTSTNTSIENTKVNPECANECPNKKRKLDADQIGGTGDKDISRLQDIDTVPCNTKIINLIRLGKPFLRQLQQDINLLKMWITFLIPKIEDGNNFGVAIQEQVLREIRIIECEATDYCEHFSGYFENRGRLIAKYAKFPFVEDYQLLIEEVDEDEYYKLDTMLREVRNHYSTLYDLTTKNMTKIVQPRTSNAENLY